MIVKQLLSSMPPAVRAPRDAGRQALWSLNAPISQPASASPQRDFCILTIDLYRSAAALQKPYIGDGPWHHFQKKSAVAKKIIHDDNYFELPKVKAEFGKGVVEFVFSQ